MLLAMNKLLKPGLIVLLYVVTLILLITTDPQQSSLIVIIAPFVVLYFGILLTLRVLISYAYKGKNISSRKRTALAAIGAGFPILCLLLQSIGQFSLRDLITLIALFGILLFYTDRASAV